MHKTTQTLLSYWFAAVWVFTAGSTLAAPQIDIEFETDQATGQEWIHAKANCQAVEAQAYEVFNAIVDYPELHHWIQNTKAENEESSNHQEFLIEFDFPWPVGEQWSRVQIQQGDSVISWNQVDGSLNINRGTIAIAEYEGQAHVDYRAILDVGYPDAFTRGYKEQFVTEFLIAIYNRLNSKEQLPASTQEISTDYLTVILPVEY
jgi:hypothetical protein